MRAKVTEQGVTIPKDLLEGIEEVEIHQENNHLVIVPIVKRDPILDLGKAPVPCGVSDASEQHDQYLYGSHS
jgi:virulence-associated protein VagC